MFQDVPASMIPHYDTIIRKLLHDRNPQKINTTSLKVFFGVCTSHKPQATSLKFKIQAINKKMERVDSIRTIRRESFRMQAMEITRKRQSANSVFSTDDELGKIVNKSIKTLAKDDPKKEQKRWEIVLLTLTAIFILIQGSMVFIINYAIDPFVPTPNFDKRFDEFENPFEDIAREMIPYVQGWFQDWQQSRGPEMHSSGLLENSQAASIVDASGSSCFDRYFDELKVYIPTTSPTYVRLVLQNLGEHMDRSPIMRKALGDLLTKPQDLQFMYEESRTCLGDNKPFVAMACAASEIADPPNLDDEETRTIFRYGVNLSVVLDALTKYFEKDFHALSEYVEAMITSRRREVERHFEIEYASDREYLLFAIAKYRTMAVASQALRSSKEMHEVPKSYNFNTIAQMNVLEAVTLDLQFNRTDNGRAGMAVAATARSGVFIDSDDLIDRLGKDWVDAYIAWNFAFVFTSTLGSERVGKLLLPSIACTGDQHTVERFAQRRVISLSLAMMHLYEVPKGGWNEDTITEREGLIIKEFYANLKNDFFEGNQDMKSKLAVSFGRSNVNNFFISDPDEDSVSKMLYNLCGERCHKASLSMSDSGFLADLDQTSFMIYVGFVMWITVVFTGIGLEMFMVLIYEKNGWSKGHENEWYIAQFLSPITGIVTLGLAAHGNYLSLFTVVLGFWKFGFPETVATMYCALFDRQVSRIKRICLFADAASAIIHHSSASLTIPMALVGIISIDRVVLDAILILCIQHMIVLLNYFRKYVYIFIQVMLEIWLEWTLFSNYENTLSNHWTLVMVANGLLLSHWVWFLSGSVSLFTELSEALGSGANDRSSLMSSLAKQAETSTSSMHLHDDGKERDVKDVDDVMLAEEESEQSDTHTRRASMASEVSFRDFGASFHSIDENVHEEQV